jgi:hemerythrin-like domain-containing protein
MDYQKEMEKGVKERTLTFEMWLRHVKNLTGQQIFQMKNEINRDPAKKRELQEEYEKWKQKKKNAKVGMHSSKSSPLPRSVGAR